MLKPSADASCIETTASLSSTTLWLFAEEVSRLPEASLIRLHVELISEPSSQHAVLGKVCRGSISRMDSQCLILAVLVASHAFAAIAADRKFGKSCDLK